MSVKVLLVEDDRVLRQALVDTLEIGGFCHRAVGSAEDALLAVTEESFSLVVSDVNMPGMDGHQLLAQLRRNHPQLPVLLMTAHAAVERAVEAMRQGAVDYLVKPFEPKALLSLVTRHAVGSGESGTGKEVLARYIHQQSRRVDQPFVAINCAAIPDNMLEATLFGHEKGAFTGAIAAQAGKFEQADGGTLLLDEISEMPLGLQAKLLRVLQEREVERVGGRKPIALDIRILATTNRDLAGEVAAGRFREDLYYRLSVFPMAWRALRERPADIVPLAERLLARHAQKMRHAQVRLSAEARACLQAYAWPGNVRELDNAIQRALILQQGGVIEAADFCLAGAIPLSVPKVATVEPLSAELGAEAGGLGDDMRRHEFQMIIDTLRTERGRRKEAAERLGISPRTLRYKLAQMRDAGLDVEASLFG